MRLLGLERVCSLPALVVVDAGVVVDRRVLHELACDRDAAAAPSAVEADAAVATGVDALIARGGRVDAVAAALAEPSWTPDDPRRRAYDVALAALQALAPSRCGSAAVGVFEGVARAHGHHDGGDAIHVGVGVAADLVVVAGVVLRDGAGAPLRPSAALDDALLPPAFLAAGAPAALDAFAVARAAAAAAQSAGRGGVFDAFADTGALLVRADAGDANAIAVRDALLDGLGAHLGGLLDIFDCAEVVLHVDGAGVRELLEAQLEAPRAAQSGGDGPWPIAPDSALGRSLARHSFASLREGLRVRLLSSDGDAVGRGLAASLAADGRRRSEATA